MQQARKAIDLALQLAESCHSSYLKALPEVRRLWNAAFFKKFVIKDKRVEETPYQEPFATIFGGSDKTTLVAGQNSNLRPPGSTSSVPSYTRH